LHLRGLDASSIEARARLRDDLGDLRPEVYEARLAVAPHCLEVAPVAAGAQDVDRVAGVEEGDEVLGVAVDDRDLTGVAQYHAEVVLPVPRRLRRGGPFGDGHDQVPAV